MSYLHFDLQIAATPRHAGAPSGDVILTQRTRAFTTVILADGLGHGMKAHVAATLYAARLHELLAHDFSFREAFCRVAEDIHRTRAEDAPYAALVAARVRYDGETTILTYDAPPAIFVAQQMASVLSGRALPAAQALVREANCFIEAGEGLLLVSDGVTQAGLGRGLVEGFTADGVARYVSGCLADAAIRENLPRVVLAKARELWGKTPGDDVSVAHLAARPGLPLVVLSGPPANRKDDVAVVRRFLDAEGRKIVCGASTAQMVARLTGTRVRVEQDAQSAITPPRYFVDGVDLVTEGVVTLNQVLNILGADPTRYEPESSVSTLAEWLRGADRVDFLVGRAPNLGGDDIAFVQQGIQPRNVVIPLLVGALVEQGKLVTCDWF